MDGEWRRVISEQIFFATPWNVFLLFVRVLMFLIYF